MLVVIKITPPPPQVYRYLNILAVGISTTANIGDNYSISTICNRPLKNNFLLNLILLL